MEPPPLHPPTPADNVPRPPYKIKIFLSISCFLQNWETKTMNSANDDKSVIANSHRVFNRSIRPWTVSLGRKQR